MREIEFLVQACLMAKYLIAVFKRLADAIIVGVVYNCPMDTTTVKKGPGNEATNKTIAILQYTTLIEVWPTHL